MAAVTQTNKQRDKVASDQTETVRSAAGNSPMQFGRPQLGEAMAELSSGTAMQTAHAQLEANRTGLPDQLKQGMESLSGFSLNDVRVHRNSSEPAQLQAEAFARGSDIQLAPGKEHHLPHEAWHVVQQMQGRVRATTQMAGGTPVNDDAGLEREADVMGARAMRGDRITQSPISVASVAPLDVAQFWPPSPLGRIRWSAYREGLANEQDVDALQTWSQRTTMRRDYDAQGELTRRTITLHKYENGAWAPVGTITMDRNQVPAAGPLPLGGAPLTTYDDNELTLHTAAAGGAGNSGLAGTLFPATLGWMDRNLHGVQQINMNPAGGAASKSIIASLSSKLGDDAIHGHANAYRAARKAAGGPPLGHNAGAGNALNTWDTRLNLEHLTDLASIEHAPAGLHVTADGMTLAGAALVTEQATLQAQRDFFAGLPVGDFSLDPLHPAAAIFASARALGNPAIAADQKGAARLLRLARLSYRAGPTGMGNQADAGYQITMTGNALANILPNGAQ